MCKSPSLSLLLSIALTLGACQSASLPTEENLDAMASEAEPSESESPPEPIVYGTFTTEQLNRVILNELGGQRGHLPEAAQDYHAMAIETGDLGVIRRASQFASATGDTSALLQLGRLWIEKDPDSVEPHLLLSYQLMESGRVGEAISHMRRVLELGGSFDFSSISNRTQYLPPAERDRTIAAIRELQLEYPEQRSLHYSLIQLLEQSRQTQAAMQELEAYRAAFGNSARLTLIEAQLMLQLNQADQALELLSSGVAAYPDNRLMRFNYARLLVQVEDLETARAQFATLAEMAPDDYETLYSLALIDLELGDIDNAERLLTQLTGVGYRLNESHFYLGFVEENQGSLASAIDHYRQVGRDSTNYLSAQRQIIRLLVRAERFDEAHDWLAMASAGEPELEITMLTVEADALISTGQVDLAYDRLTSAIARFPENTELLFARSLLSERLGDMAAAEADLRRIIELQPEDARALNHLGYTLADRTDRYEEALALLERAIAVSPEDPAIIDSLGWAQFKLGRYEEALGNLQRAYAAFPDPEVAAHLGEVLWMMGRRSEASRVWENALRERPDSELLLRVIERLDPRAES